jgi:hypothetical protein
MEQNVESLHSLLVTQMLRENGKDSQMQLNRITFMSVFIAPLALQGAIINLGTSAEFAVLAGAAITNTGPSIISSNIGVAPGTAITGFFPSGVYTGTMHTNDAVAIQAQTDLLNAYSTAEGLPCDPANDLTGTDLGGLSLLPGTYCFSSSAQLTGTLTLDNVLDPTGTYVFQIVSTLTTASISSVVYTGANTGGNVFWQVGSSATLGTGTQFSGNILALAAITLTTGADINCGRALAINEAVTLDTNNITPCAAIDPVGVPEPAPVAIVCSSLAALYFRRRHLHRS